jgi:hypothetical protein
MYHTFAYFSKKKGFASMDISLSTPNQFVQFLAKNRIQTFHFVTKNGEFVASHSLLEPIARLLTLDNDYDQHEGLFCQVSSTGVLQSAAVHRTCRGPGAGGVRNWVYDTILDFFKDGLRLSKGMTHKNALAGLWWGGGKGVIARNSGTGLQYNDAPELRTMEHL